MIGDGLFGLQARERTHVLLVALDGTPDQPAQIIAVLKNTSRRTVRTKGTLTVYDQSGAAVSQSIVPDVPVLPESEREVAIPAINPDKPSLPAGDYRVEVKIDVGLPALIVGETTLKVS